MYRSTQLSIRISISPDQMWPKTPTFAFSRSQINYFLPSLILISRSPEINSHISPPVKQTSTKKKTLSLFFLSRTSILFQSTPHSTQPALSLFAIAYTTHPHHGGDHPSPSKLSLLPQHNTHALIWLYCPHQDPAAYVLSMRIIKLPSKSPKPVRRWNKKKCFSTCKILYPFPKYWKPSLRKDALIHHFTFLTSSITDLIPNPAEYKINPIPLFGGQKERPRSWQTLSSQPIDSEMF